MKETCTETFQQRLNRLEKLKNIALELVQQLKGRQLDFEDAEMVLRCMRSQLEQDKNSRLL